MTHLRIIQNNGVTEEVSSSVILKLYELATSGDLDNTSVLLGRINADGTYLEYIDYLTGIDSTTNLKRYPDLYITATKIYINFADPAVKSALMTVYGDGVGITSSDVNTSYLNKSFKNNTSIHTFNELSLFTGVTLLLNLLFMGASNLTSIDTSRITHVGDNCITNTKVASLDLSSLTNIGGASAFSGNTLLTSVDFGLNSSLTALGATAFGGCTSLQTITIPTTVTTIPNYCFYNDGNLTTINGTSNVTSIGESAFENCSKLTTIDISNVTTLKLSSFKGCSKLNNIILNSGLTSIPSSCFMGCSTLSAINLQYCTSLGSSAFSGCTSLSNVTWPNQNFTMAGNAFKGTNLTGPLTVDYITSIGANIFENTKVTDVDFSGSTFTNFPVLVFKGVSTLTKIKFPTTLTTIGTANSSDMQLGSGNSSIDIYGFDNLTTVIGDTYIARNIGNAVYFGLFETGNQPLRKLSNDITIKQIYFPKYKYTSGTIYTMQTYSFAKSMFNMNGYDAEGTGNSANKYIHIGLLYFKNLETIYSVMFYGARPKNLVINNTTPPQFTLSTYGQTTYNGVARDFTANPNFTEWDTKPFGVIPYDLNDINCMTIYVPDSAVATYQANSLYNMYTIRGINEVNPDTNQPYLTRYATNALWEAAGRPDDALIEEYM